MSLQTVLELAGAKLNIKENKLGVIFPTEQYVLKGESRVILKALAQCLGEKDIPMSPMNRFDLMSYGLKDSTDLEVATHRGREVEPRECTMVQAVAAIDAGEEMMEYFTDCVVSGNSHILKGIQQALGRGEIKGGQLMLGQTANLEQVAERLKFYFQAGIARREAGPSAQDGHDSGPEDSARWADEMENDNSGQRESWDQGEAISDGSCERWINRYSKMDFNKLARGENDFYLHDWLAEKTFSAGAQKKFFSKVPRVVNIKVWARKITDTLRTEGVDVSADEVDKAGLWAIRKYIGQVNVVGSGENRRIVRRG